MLNKYIYFSFYKKNASPLHLNYSIFFSHLEKIASQYHITIIVCLLSFKKFNVRDMESEKISQKHAITSRFIETLSKYRKLDPTFLCDLQFTVPVENTKNYSDLDIQDFTIPTNVSRI